jgi:hypothetical protein
MKLPGTPRPPEPISFEARIEPGALAAARAGSSVTARVARFQTDLATRSSHATWSVLHALGAHRWREGYETDPDRGMSRYRGSRCTICDDPWEGW